MKKLCSNQLKDDYFHDYVTFTWSMTTQHNMSSATCKLFAD